MKALQTLFTVFTQLYCVVTALCSCRAVVDLDKDKTFETLSKYLNIYISTYISTTITKKIKEEIPIN